MKFHGGGCSVMSYFLWLRGLQHTRVLCPSLSTRVCANLCPLNWWCHPTVSSSVIPFSSCLLLSFLASGFFSGLKKYKILLIKKAKNIKWSWARLKAGEGNDRGWDSWMASPTQWTWVWANSRRWWRTGTPGMLQSDTAELLNNNNDHIKHSEALH